jgi:hypothetical protein
VSSHCQYDGFLQEGLSRVSTFVPDELREKRLVKSERESGYCCKRLFALSDGEWTCDVRDTEPVAQAMRNKRRTIQTIRTRHRRYPMIT